MNNRIEELAEHAAKNFTENFSWNHLPDIDKDILGKFSVLIIQECAKVAREHTLVKSGLNKDYDGIVYVEDAIKQHFGINQGIVSGGGGGYEGPRIGGKGGKDDSTFVCPPEENGPNMFSKYDGDGW